MESEFSVLLCDIDHFKSVNDELGHPAGDMALHTMAPQLAQTCRTVNCVSRGEEFLIILPATPIDHAADLAERLRHSVTVRAINAGRNRVCTALIHAV